MKITKVLLRWYKSFNVNYLGYEDRRDGIVPRPWNFFVGRDNEQAPVEYPFIEIELEEDITTIVGANESGKSHLLSAIHKVLVGMDPNSSDSFRKTDICHYAAERSQNTDLWPYIGLQFSCSQKEFESIEQIEVKIKELTDLGKHPWELPITLILGGFEDGSIAKLYVGESGFELDAGQLDELRKLFPVVKFIHSNVSIANSISIASLIQAYENSEKQSQTIFDPETAHSLLGQLLELAIPSVQQASTNNSVFIQQVKILKDEAEKQKRVEENTLHLELLLFRDILGVSQKTLEDIYKLKHNDRPYIESLVAAWNKEIEKQLDISRYWQQDQSFELRVNYKNGIIYFEITDKTECIYTFSERSSGLKYFLSYYIQAKSLGNQLNGESAILLMDEPDSFLSILGQKNLLRIFEDLVSPEKTRQNRQLVYTSHSPFLINRNYPRRIRLVRKGDAEEGTQCIPNIQVRRYEPIRTALGVDCAQTIFMGATSLILEGPTDQFLISELTRGFVSPDSSGQYLDLNSVILTSSSNGAPGIEKMISASQWGDEAPATLVVLMDSDQAGRDTRKRLIGKARKASKLLDEKFVLLIGEILQEYEENHPIVTIEDILPVSVYQKAIISYLEYWHPELTDNNTVKKIKSEFSSSSDFANNGLVEATNAIFEKFVFEEVRNYDKFGVLQEAVKLVLSGQCKKERQIIQESLIHLSDKLRESIELAEDIALKYSGKQAISRVIQDSLKKYSKSIGIFEIIRVLKRIDAEVELLGLDGENLKAEMLKLQSLAENLKKKKQSRIQGEEWDEWKRKLNAIRKNPVSPQLSVAQADNVEQA